MLPTAFIALVRAGMDGSAPDPALFERLSADDWEAIFRMARRQTVCGLCYDALCRLPGRLLPMGSVLPRWVARVAAIEAANGAMRAALAELLGVLEAEGLHPLVQKGLSVARFYPNPDARECGDIDLWFPDAERERAVELFRSIGAAPERQSDGSVKCTFRGFVVEIHRTLLNIGGSALEHALADAPLRDDTPGAGVPSPAPLRELLLVDAHIMHHAIGTGIGLRHICDYVVAARALRGRYDAAAFAAACRAAGIAKWTALLNAFAVEVLGADAADLPPSGWHGRRRLPVTTLLAIIREGGNFGHHSPGASPHGRAAGARKLHTLTMFARRSHFAASVAPTAALRTFCELLLGQLKK